MSELTTFVHDSLAKGLARQDIEEVLKQAGWPTDEIDDAIKHFAPDGFPVPVPMPRRSGSAREAFIYLATFMTLYMSAISVGVVLTSLVDILLPDPVRDAYATSEGAVSAVLGSVATLIVALPIYLVMTSAHVKHYATNPALRTSVVRRWLTYLTMFAAFAVGLSAITSIVFSALQGELATRLLLKAVIVFVVAACVFLFYQWELKIGEEQGR